MLDQLTRDIKTRLDTLLSEADKLRHALTALGSPDENPEGSTTTRSSVAQTGSGRANGATTSAGSRRQTSRSRAKHAAVASSSGQRKPRAPKPARQAGAGTRAASGATKRAVVEALAPGKAMTAAEVAAATGLARATVSTTLSRLAKTGDLTKVARGYQIPQPASQTSTTA